MGSLTFSDFVGRLELRLSDHDPSSEKQAGLAAWVVDAQKGLLLVREPEGDWAEGAIRVVTGEVRGCGFEGHELGVTGRAGELLEANVLLVRMSGQRVPAL